MPIGTPMTMAPAVTLQAAYDHREDPVNVIVRLPHGAVRNSTNPISDMAGRPFANKKKQMRATEHAI